MSRTTTVISRAPSPRAESAMAPKAIALAAITTTSALANEHPRRIHHHESGQQAEHHRRGGEADRRRLPARRIADLSRELDDDLRNRSGAEAEAQDRGDA